MNIRGTVSVSALLIAATLSASPAFAQTAPLEQEATRVDEIIVTATRREQRLIEAPVAVTAVGGEQLENSGVTDIRELTSLAPSVQFQTPGGGADSSIRIRGVGTTSTNPGLESSVGVIIDGVIRARTGVALSELGDLQSIEVLRGPQGTLFGRNTSSGIINVMTKQPSFDGFSGNITGTYGNYDDRRLSGAINIPLVDDELALRIEGSYELRDGFYKDANSDQRLDNLDRQFVRAKLLWRPTENVSWTFSADYTNRNENCCVAVLAIAGPTYNLVNQLAAARGGIGYTSTNPFDRQASKNNVRRNQEDIEDGGVSASGQWDMGWATLNSVTAFRSWEAYRSQDFDHSGADLGFFAPNGLHQKFDVFTQELRLQGDAGNLDWLVGLFYSDETVLNDSAYRIGADYPLIYGGAATFQASTLAAFRPGDGARGIGEQSGQDFSLFTHNVFHVTDALSITAGLRYTQNDKEIDFRGENFNPACDSAVRTSDAAGITRFCAPFWDTRLNPSGDSDSRTEKATTGTANIAYRISPELNTYLSYSRGYKSGGYNFDRAGFTTPATPNAADLAFVEETVDAYEFGLKGEFFDRSLRANFAAFYQTFEGFQLIEFTGVSFVVRSLAEVVTKGAELEITWEPTDGLTLTNGLSYTDAYYPVNVGNRQYSGLELEQSPDWVNVSSITYEFPIGGSLTGVAYADARYSSEFFTGGFDPNRIQPSFTTANVRFSLRDANEAWQLDLYARNVFDQDYYRRVIPATFQTGSYSAFLGDPRTYGVTLRRNF
ncbi:TonB-dependent receptor [Brevundimonas sp. NIBR11]|uniref:TonB-dependent receptor n=1 Tax=Brevundimonas sp. NIBR11 TaxID=3015999 RepID=UPI0022F0E497|nr:TonB-dependent receptor [Brevundimonas sp. NIBR11]WGM30163.1 Vitamin B12 transporter BtuB [Brevundimonas sp. NIBR11]